MAGMQGVVRGVVDVDQHGVEASSGLVGVEAVPGRHREEVAVHEPGARVLGQLGTAGHQIRTVPTDHLVQCVDDEHLADPVVRDDGAGRPPEPQPADHDVEVVGDRREHGEPQRGQGHLGRGEEAGHEVLLAQPHLVHLDAERRLDPPAQRDLPHGGLGPGQLLDPR